MNYKLLVFVPAMMILLAGNIGESELSNFHFFDSSPTMEALNDKIEVASEEEFMCNVGGPFIQKYAVFTDHCCPDITYKLTYLGLSSAQTNWSISTPGGFHMFTRGTNKSSRVAYVRFRGCGDMTVTVQATCPNGSVGVRSNSITHICC